MVRAIVHIGMHKTGSSSIQSALFGRMAGPAHEYVKLGSANHSERIFSLFTDSPESYHLHQKRGLDRSQIEKYNAETREMLIRQFQTNRAPNVIISGEAVGLLEKASLERFREFLRERVQEILIVGYVRPPCSFMESAFQQYVKGSVGHLRLAALYPNYRQRFRKFDEVFGRNNVRLWKFDPDSFPEGDVVLDFCQRLGIKLRAGAVRRDNVSLSREALSLLFAYRKFGPGYGVGQSVVEENNYLIKELKKIGGARLRFAEEAVRPVLDVIHDDLEWMEERLGEPLTESLPDTADAVHSEEDLLRLKPVAIDALRGMLSERGLPAALPGETPHDVAQLVHALRVKVVEEWAARRSASAAKPSRVVTASEMVARLKKGGQDVLDGISDDNAAGLISEALIRLGKHIDTIEQGVVNMQGLGSFRVQQVEREKSGCRTDGKKLRYRASNQDA